MTYFPQATAVHMTQLRQWKATHEGLVSLNILWNFCLDQCRQSTVMRAVHFFSFVISLPMWSCQADLRWPIISIHVRLESLSYKFHKPHYLYGSCISTSSTENWSGELGYNKLLWSKFCTDKYFKNSFSSILYLHLQIHLHYILIVLKRTRMSFIKSETWNQILNVWQTTGLTHKSACLSVCLTFHILFWFYSCCACVKQSVTVWFWLKKYTVIKSLLNYLLHIFVNAYNCSLQHETVFQNFKIELVNFTL